VVVGSSAHGLAELADLRPPGRDPGAEGAGLFEFAEEGSAAAEAVELLG
jgi:hypothetical protein